jgi:hypothetical protein
MARDRARAATYAANDPFGTDTRRPGRRALGAMDDVPRGKLIGSRAGVHGHRTTRASQPGEPLGITRPDQ